MINRGVWRQIDKVKIPENKINWKQMGIQD